MRPLILSCGAVLFGAAGLAQAPPQAKGGSPEAGVSPLRILERPEVRVGRVTLQAGATRRVHTHEEFPFQLFVPLTGKIELILGTEKMDAKNGEAYFIDRNQPHGFRNTGTEPATALEIFIKDPNAKALAKALALAK